MTSRMSHQCGILWANLAFVGLCCGGVQAAAAAPAEPDRTPVYNVPRLTNIVIDGQADDWGEAGFRVEVIAAMDGRVKAASDLDGRFRLGWDDRGLLILLKIRDDVSVENDAEDQLWQNDSVELYLVNRRGGTELIQVVLAPGVDGKHPELRHHFYDHRKDAALKQTKLTLLAARTRTDDGYVMEVMLPWDVVGLKAEPGLELGFQMFVNDTDQAGARPFSAAWYPAVGVFQDTRRVHRLRLADKASPPVQAVGRGWYDGWKSLRAVVVAVPELAGRSVTAQVEGKEIARGTLVENAGHAIARLRGPLPPAGVEWKQLDILVNGKTIDMVALPDLSATQPDATAKLAFVFNPFCFTGPQFPEGEFENPQEAENILGPYTVHVTYYDAQFQPVTRAAQPGRYGAIVEIKTEAGTVLQRACMLWRLPEGFHPREVKPITPAGLPGELGLDDSIMQEQAAVVGDYLKGCILSDFERSPGSASLLAWLKECAPGTRVTDRNGPGNSNLKWLHDLKQKAGKLQPLKYLVRLPAGAADDPARKWPVIFLLHGSGERGLALEALGRNRLLTYAKARKDFPFIVITPHCPLGQWWQVPDLDDLYNEVITKYPVDIDRVYLTGMSMGGYGSWMWAIEHPERFAAVAPICGGGDPRDLERIKDVPVWNFHGAKDPAVPIQRSQEMIDGLRKVDGRVRFTVYTDGGHGIWDAVFESDALYAWFLRQVRGRPDEAAASAPGATPTEERQLQQRVKP